MPQKKTAGRPRSPNPKEGTTRKLLRLPPGELREYERCANRLGISFNRFASQALMERRHFLEAGPLRKKGRPT